MEQMKHLAASSEMNIKKQRGEWNCSYYSMLVITVVTKNLVEPH